MASKSRKYRIKKVPLSEVKDDLSKYLRIAEQEEVVITRHGKPAGILIGFESEEDWIDYRLENDSAILKPDRSLSAELAQRMGRSDRKNKRLTLRVRETFSSPG